MDAGEIRRTLSVFKPGKLVEVRSFSGKGGVTSGYFKDFEKLIQNLGRFPEETYYFVMNEIKDDCYSRDQCEKILSKPKAATTDNDIQRREWLLIDADPVRVTGVSATDAEKAQAYEVIRKAYRYLRHMGFSAPVAADSGNGYHLLYRIDTRNDTAQQAIIKAFLQAMDALFSNAEVKIDTAVFNASRVTKLYGTVARKGANTPERPHRQSRLLAVPEAIKPTRLALLQKVAEIMPKPAQAATRVAAGLDAEGFMARHGIRVAKVADCSAGKKYVLEACLFDASHKAPDAAIIVLENGAIAYHCFHNSCQGYKWQDVRLKYEPGAYDAKAHPRITQPQPTVVRERSQPDRPPGAEKFLRLRDIQQIDRSQIVSVPSGLTALDKKIIGFNKGEFSVWSGGNGSGKSTLLSQMALEAIDKGFKAALFSGELTNHRMKHWLHLQAAGRAHVAPTQHENVYYTPKAIGEKIDAWASERLWIYNNETMEANAVMAHIKAHIEKQHTDIVIIDNLMSLDLTQMTGDKYDRQSMMVLALSDMAKRYNVHIHFVCHPRKPNGFLRKADISGTADLTNAADNVMMVHRVNSDFQKSAKEFFGEGRAKQYYHYSNVIEVMKNRDLGIEDELIGMYFEKRSKRMMNEPTECKSYKWDDFPIHEVTDAETDCPFL